jgi:hypothetical protein
MHTYVSVFEYQYRDLVIFTNTRLFEAMFRRILSNNSVTGSYLLTEINSKLSCFENRMAFENFRQANCVWYS